jgi:hypothetical protein
MSNCSTNCMWGGEELSFQCNKNGFLITPSFLAGDKLLVTTGSSFGSNKTEILDICNAGNSCSQLASFPIDFVYGTTGGLIDNVPLICGGYTLYNAAFDECLVIGKTETTVATTMSTPRGDAASATLNGNTLWVTGGLATHSPPPLQTTELVQLNGTRPGPDLPIPLARHCVVALNSTTFLVIGGYTSFRVTNAVYYYRFDTNRWIPGPPLSTTRQFHACTRFTSALHGNLDVVLVAGGSERFNFLDTSEILIVGTDSWTPGTYHSVTEIFSCCACAFAFSSKVFFLDCLLYCFAGPSLPRPTTSAQLIPTLDKLGALHIGGSFTENDIYKLECTSTACTWIQLQQTFSIERVNYVAMYVPSSYVDCATTTAATAATAATTTTDATTTGTFV